MGQKIGGFIRSSFSMRDELDKKGAGPGVVTTSTSDEVSTIVECDSFSPGDDLMLGAGRQAR